MKSFVIFDCDGTLLDMSKGGTPFAGIMELVHRLHQEEYELAIWTARDRVSLERYMAPSGLRRYFEAIKTVSEVSVKPHPQGLHEILGVHPAHRGVVIGDSWSDMQGAKMKGCFALGAVWNGQSDIEVLNEFGADAIVRHPSECYEWIVKFLKE
jgi:phosphoglycolate phosphatase-like HAD superfamily hydrolase